MQTESYRLEAEGAKLLEQWKAAQQAARLQQFANIKAFRECQQGHGTGASAQDVDRAEELMRAQDDAWARVEAVQAQFIAALRAGR